ncbi:MAG: hypothetical protein KH326_10160, partial [Ruminococcus callidus]|uniref:hypothetical protein n=1 Tax=Ruminococcus callidus TaxID=40519 RepID=UPI0023F3C5CE
DVFTSIFVKYDGKFASRWRAKSPDALCAVLPKEHSPLSDFDIHTNRQAADGRFRSLLLFPR